MHRHPLDNARVVDEYVHRAESLLDIRDHSLNTLFISGIADIAFCVNTLSFIISHSFVHICLGTAVECNFCTGLSQSLCHSESDTIGGSSDERNLSFK